MFWFYVALIMAILAALYFAFMPRYHYTATVRNASGYNEKERRSKSIKKYGFVFVGLSVLALIFSSICTVGTHNVGIPTEFSKTTGDTYSAGLHFKAPWVKVTDVDATVQPEEYKGDDCIYVKIADGGSACISLAYRWRIDPDHADVAFADYRNAKNGLLDGIREALVSTNIKAAINEELGNYDPLGGAKITEDMTPAQLANVDVNVVPDYEQINTDIQTNVQNKIADLGGLIDIQSVTISYVKLPDSTQARIDAYNTAIQNTRIAIQDIATKDAQATANERLANSLQDPNVLVSKCLDGLISGDIDNEPGFSCSLGGGSAVVIPGTK